jgi:hypothetical protein
VIAVAAAALGLLVPGSAQAALLDANCPGPANDELTTGPGESREAHTFQALHTGTAVRGQTAIDKLGAGGDWVMQILDADPATGSPINGVLGSGTIPDSRVPTGVSTLSVDFSSPVPVVAGHLYALVLAHGARYGIPDRSGSPCAGAEWGSGSPTGAWLGPYDFDWVFSIFVDPPNAFTVGKLKGRKLKVTVPGPGSVTLAQQPLGPGEGAAIQDFKVLRASTKHAAAAGTVGMKVRLNKTGRSVLRHVGKLKRIAQVTYTPDGGTAATQTLKLKLRG